MRILSLAPLAGPGLDALRALGEVELDPWSAQVPFRLYAPEQLIERAAGFDVLLVEADFVTAEVFERTDLRIVGVARGEPNNVDIAAATEHGVIVLRTPGRNANAVAELTLGVMLALLRHIVEADAEVRAGRWIVDGVLPQQRLFGREIAGSVVGVVGCGAIGRAVAAKVRALGARVVGYDPFADASALERDGIEPLEHLGQLFALSDIVTLHATLSDATRGMIDAEVLKHAEPGLLLVNAARFDLLDEQALLDALRDGRIGAAALDHFHNEFLPADHPLVSMPNVILTPHIGGSTHETIANHTTILARAITGVLAGEVPDAVANPDVLPLR